MIKNDYQIVFLKYLVLLHCPYVFRDLPVLQFTSTLQYPIVITITKTSRYTAIYVLQVGNKTDSSQIFVTNILDLWVKCLRIRRKFFFLILLLNEDEFIGVSSIVTQNKATLQHSNALYFKDQNGVKIFCQF